MAGDPRRALLTAAVRHAAMADDAPDGDPPTPADGAVDAGPWATAALATGGPPAAAAAMWGELADAVEAEPGAWAGWGGGGRRGG